VRLVWMNMAGVQAKERELSRVTAPENAPSKRGTMPQAQSIVQGQTFAMPRAALAFSHWCRFRCGCGAS
jgi:hypothetical protein